MRTDRRFYGYRADHAERSASVVKGMLMVAYLNESRVAHRALSGFDKSLLGPMIRGPDNLAAQRVFEAVGKRALRALARRVGMTRVATNPIWGETRVTARDRTKFFLHIDTYLLPRHRTYGYPTPMPQRQRLPHRSGC